ncbi:MAG: hypothetical protein JXQ87_12375 [Bacteroidia bacterium]
MLHIDGFRIDSKTIKKSKLGIRDILLFPLIIVGTPFLLVGFFFFSFIDRIKNGKDNDWTETIEKWKNYEFKLTVAEDNLAIKSKVDVKGELYSIESTPSISQFKNFYLTDYNFTNQHGFFLGFRNDSDFMHLIILTENWSRSVELGEGNWTLEDDHHHENEFCQLKNSKNKNSVVYTLKPF